MFSEKVGVIMALLSTLLEVLTCLVTTVSNIGTNGEIKEMMYYDTDV